MKSPRFFLSLALLLFAIVALAALQTGRRGQAAVPDTDDIQGPFAGDASVPGESPRADSLPAAPDEPVFDREINPRHNPLQFEADMGRRGTWDRPSVPTDPLIAASQNQSLTPGLDFSFLGVSNPTGCGGCSPPDTVGDVGPNHYIQMVNATKVAIFDKAGNSLQAPFNLGDLWSSTTCTGDFGDPIVLYDSQADRWLLSQFNSGNQMCVAISKTADPQGAYWLYNWAVPQFPDYFKFGVWPDAYYMGANEGTYTAYAFDRVKMLAGQPATFQRFTGGTNFYLPADLDGAAPPPAGAPGIFYTFKDNSFHGGSDRIEVRELDVDFVTPANTTFTLVASLNVTPFTYTVCGFFNFSCAFQPGTGQRVDVVSEWPMHRFPYRNFGSHQTLVGTFTVGGGTGQAGSAIRWFELRKTGGSWTLFQQGTQDLNDGHDRYIGSIAMDDAGNIALGYSVSSSSLFPSIRYATRLASDPLGTLGAEAVLIAGAGSQTGSNRWGDYAAMGLDPANGCSFWFTSEYYSSTSSTAWKTRVGVFTIPECDGGGGTPTPTATGPTPTSTNTPPGPTPTFTATPRRTPTPGGPTPTNTPVAGTQTHIADLDGSSVPNGPSRWNATVTVVVRDQNGALVSGATVSGSWSNGSSGNGSCVTNASGTCAITKTLIRNSSQSVTFTVTNIAKAGTSYNPAANTDPDGDSNGTVIVVNKP